MDNENLKTELEKLQVVNEYLADYANDINLYDRLDFYTNAQLDNSIGLSGSEVLEYEYLLNIADSLMQLIGVKYDIESLQEYLASLPTEPDETENETEEPENGVNG